MEGQNSKMEHKMGVSRKKKAKKEGEYKKNVGEAVATEEKRRYEGNCSSNIEVNNAQVVMAGDQHDNEDWRAWWKPDMLVDEQMSWGLVWFSFWDVDANSHGFYSDVVEEDLWDLKSIQYTPQ